MPLVSITEAAEMADLSRPYFHEAYVRTGKISVDRSNPKKPKIDTMELIRVFGKIKSLTTNIHSEDINNTTLHSDKNTTLQLELEKIRIENEGLKRLSEERLARLYEKDSLLVEKNQEILHYRERIHGLEARYDRLLEAKHPTESIEAPKIPFWKHFKSLLNL